MSILLGNLTIPQIEERTGVTFPDELKQLLETCHQDNANKLGENEWHCFDLPFVIVCGSMELARKIYEHLQPLTGDFKETLGISLNKK